MTVLRASDSAYGLNIGKPNQTYVLPNKPIDSWTRNSQWLEITPPGPTEQKFVGLLAITDDDSNYVRIVCSGATTVDWGDGTAPVNITSGGNAEKQYTFSSINSATQTSQGYRQVIITITPQAGQNLTSVALNQQHTRTTMRGALKWLDIAVGSPNLTGLSVASSMGAQLLERFNLVSSALTSFSSMFQNCFALKSVTINTSAAVTNTNNMFNTCRSLEVAPFFNTSSVTTFASMFSGCYALAFVPEYNTSSVTTFNSTFLDCYNLRYVPFFNTSNATTIQSMFRNCYTLQEIPPFNFSQVTIGQDFLNSAISMKRIPKFNFPLLTNAQTMFCNMYSLEVIPSLSLPNATNVLSIFENNYSAVTAGDFSAPALSTATAQRIYTSCYSLISVGDINLPIATNTAIMFSLCYSLQNIKSITTSSALLNTTSMFENCIALTSVPLFNTSAVTNATNMFNVCRSLQNLPNFNFSSVINFSGTFANMISLMNLPAGITMPSSPSVTNSSYMFESSNILNFPPFFNTSNVTTVQNMFNNGNRIVSLPAYDMSSIIGATEQNIIPNNPHALSSSLITNTRWSINYSNARLSANALNTIYTNLATLNPSITNVSGNGTVVTYTVSDVTAFYPGRTVTITGVDPSAYNLTNATVVTVNKTNKTFTVNNAATGTYVSGGTATIQDNRTITVTSNHGTPDDNPTIATNKGWTVTGS